MNNIVNISPEVALREAQAENGWLRNRLLIQAQAIADLQAQAATQTPIDGEIITEETPE